MAVAKRARKASPRSRTTAATLLVELLTEELPPKSLKRLSEVFAQSLYDGLKGLGFLAPESAAQVFATPRRLAVRISGVLARQPDRVAERRGPAVTAALDAEGRPTPALLGFARSCGVELKKLARERGDKGEYFVYRTPQKGEPLARHLAAVVEAGVKKLPVAKLMRWGAGEAEFVRPVHGLVMLHGKRPVPGAVLGVKSGAKTRGHRFLSRGPLAISSAEKYEEILRRTGKVIAGFAERRETIRKAALAEAARRGALVFPASEHDATLGPVAQSILRSNEELLDEVSAIVEWPTVYVGEFDASFLAVPPEVISLTMQKNQKYFALVNETGQLLPAYFVVSNIETRRPAQIVHGNERVLRARLADAKFFFDQDRKTRLDGRVPRLAQVLYQQKLGTLLERVERVEQIAVEIAKRLAAAPAPGCALSAEDIDHVSRAAHLCKADLLTDMVGEFPELQGAMGKYYARHDGEYGKVPEAIEQHYWPKSASGELPHEPLAMPIALADKLEALVGIYGIGLVPSGEKDPYALRRHALGVARILIERGLPLDLPALLELSRAAFRPGVLAESVATDVYGFLLDRLPPYLGARGFRPDEIDAVLSLKPARLDQAIKRLEALQAFRRLPEAEALAAANKRIQNILRQAGQGNADAVTPAIDGSLLREDAERRLAGELSSASNDVMPLAAAGEYEPALKRLAQLRTAVDAFFDQVMVMVDEDNVRRARLQLLAQIRWQFRQIADISRLQG